MLVRYNEECKYRHQLFIKEHSVRKQLDELPRGKTLYVLNIPPRATVKSIKNSFSQTFAPVKYVTFTELSSSSKIGFKNGYIVFEKESGMT